MKYFQHFNLILLFLVFFGPCLLFGGEKGKIKFIDISSSSWQLSADKNVAWKNVQVPLKNGSNAIVKIQGRIHRFERPQGHDFNVYCTTIEVSSELGSRFVKMKFYGRGPIGSLGTVKLDNEVGERIFISMEAGGGDWSMRTKCLINVDTSQAAFIVDSQRPGEKWEIVETSKNIDDPEFKQDKLFLQEFILK